MDHNEIRDALGDLAALGYRESCSQTPSEWRG